MQLLSDTCLVKAAQPRVRQVAATLLFLQTKKELRDNYIVQPIVFLSSILGKLISFSPPLFRTDLSLSLFQIIENPDFSPNPSSILP